MGWGAWGVKEGSRLADQSSLGRDHGVEVVSGGSIAGQARCGKWGQEREAVSIRVSWELNGILLPCPILRVGG